MTADEKLTLLKRWRGAVKFTDQWLIHRLVMLAALFAVLFVLVAVDFSPKTIAGLEIGRPSPLTVRADRTITLTDSHKTQELRKQAAADVPKAYRFEADSLTKARADVGRTFQNVRVAIENEKISFDQRRRELARLVPAELDEKDIEWLASRKREELVSLEERTNELLGMVMTDKIGEPNLPAKREEAKRRAAAIEDRQLGRLAGVLAAANIKTNTVVDKKATQKAINRAIDKIKPVLVRKLKGETIVTEGEILTAMQERMLRALGLTKTISTVTAGRLLGQAIIVIALIMLGLIYLREFQPRVYRDNRLLFLLFVILAAVSAAAKGVAPLLSPFLIPVASAAMLATILVRPTVGIMMAVTIALVTGMIVNNPQYWLFSFTPGLFSVYLTARISHRSDLTRAGLWLMGASGILALAISLVYGVVGLDLAVAAGWGVVGGFTAIVITIGALQFLEYAFNITTDLKLLELANPTQPLLKELMVTAPGTYNHSIITGNLVESVAAQVGANTLLVRAGAYYHDIGKIKRPFFFVENQYGDNPHDKTQPNLSYLIIAAHVKEGVELAKKHRLPEEVIDIISQHHGTTLVSYFYSRAKEKEKNSSVTEHHFRYQGEKPRSKEAALIMLADAVEAAARALPKPTHNRIEQVVKKIVRERLRDGQLDESDLTLGALETIINGFTTTLTTMYHSRIEYPELETISNGKRVAAVGSIGRKPVGRPGGVGRS